MTRCARCHRELQDPNSILQEMGPTCRRRKAAEANSGKEQLELQFPAPRIYFGIDNLLDQYQRVKKILNKRGVFD